MSDLFDVRLERRIPGFTQFWNAFYSLPGVGSPSDVAVYAALCSFASDPKEVDREVNPSGRAIAARAHLSRAKVFESLKALETAGAIRRDSTVGQVTSITITSLTDIVEHPTRPGSGHHPSSIRTGPVQNLDTKKTKKKTIEEYSPEFDQLWLIYPRKEGKRKAFESVQVLLAEGLTIERLVGAVKNYAITVRDTEFRYVKHGSTFFNEKNRPFEDYMIAPLPDVEGLDEFAAVHARAQLEATS